MWRHGFATFAVDLGGHGKSPGQGGHVDRWSQWTEDAAAFVGYVEGIAGGVVVPVGHSFGGATLLSTVLADKLVGTRRFILSSPALRVKAAVPGWKTALARVTSKIVPKLALDNESDPQDLSRIPTRLDTYLTNPLLHNNTS